MIQKNNKNIKRIYKGKAPILPDEYQEVEYISTDGYAYIDTGIKPSTRDKHEAVFDCQLTNSSTQILFGSCLGAWDAADNNWILFRPFQSATINRVDLWYRTELSYNYATDNHFFPGTKQQLLIEQTSDTNVRVRLNSTLNQSIVTRNVPIEADQPNYFLLKSQRSNMATPIDSTMKIYHYKLSQSGVLVRDFIPCYRRLDNKPGMYDLVNNVFYANAYSSGEFTVGANVTYKKVGIIVDSQGRTIFSDSSNLFKGYNSEWSLHIGIYTNTGNLGVEVIEPRLVFFFKVKPNTTYRYTSLTAGDRMCVYAIDEEHNTPPVPENNQPPYGASVRRIENRYTLSGLTDYTFTTSSSDRMVYILCARKVRPTGIYVREV